MNAQTKIHLLTQELIPIIKELEHQPKQIVLDHIEKCDECQKLYSTTLAFDDSIPKLNHSNQVELKPLKKLVQYNTGLKSLLIAVRGVILFYILYSGFTYSESIDFSLFQTEIFLFYTPVAIFLLIFTFTFFNKKWLWFSLLADLFIILLLGKILQGFF